jgi:hypothetical protein
MPVGICVSVWGQHSIASALNPSLYFSFFAVLLSKIPLLFSARKRPCFEMLFSCAVCLGRPQQQAPRDTDQRLLRSGFLTLDGEQLGIWNGAGSGDDFAAGRPPPFHCPTGLAPPTRGGLEVPFRGVDVSANESDHVAIVLGELTTDGHGHDAGLE